MAKTTYGEMQDHRGRPITLDQHRALNRRIRSAPKQQPRCGLPDLARLVGAGLYMLALTAIGVAVWIYAI